MRNRDQRLRTLPCSQTLEVYLAVLGDKPVRARTGIGNDRAVLERRTNTALERAVLLLKGGRAADEALAALGQVRAQNEVELAACAGNLLDAGGLSAFIWPNRSTSTMLLMEMKLSICAMVRASLV